MSSHSLRRSAGSRFSKTKRRQTPSPLQLQLLESRDNPAPFPSIQGLAAAGATRPLLGETVSYGFNFTNTDASLTGFGPYIVVAVDTTGPDGAATPTDPADDDGFGTPTVRAAGAPLTPVGTTVLTASKTYDNPFTGQTGLAAPAGFQAGDTIFIYQLPFISFTPGQSTDVDITLATSNKADVNVPLNLTVIPAFRDTNATAPFDPQISAPVATDAIPQLYRLEKIYLGPENETATGPNFIRSYRLDIDIATGQTVNGLSVTDDLASSMQIVGRTKTNMGAFLASSGLGNNVLNLANLGGTATTTAPDGTITYNFGNVIGVDGRDASFQFDFYVPRDKASPPGGQVVPQTPLANATTGTDSTTNTNTASSNGQWLPIDTRDRTGPGPGGAINVPKAAPDNGPHTLEQQSIAIQKSFELVDRATGAVIPTGAPIRPGNVLIRYTLNFQVSDYYAFDDVFIRDSLADGQRLFIGTFGGGTSAFPVMTINNAFLTGTPNGSRITSTTAAAGGLPANRFSGNQVIEYQQRYSSGVLSNPTSFPVAGPAAGTIGANVFLNQAPAIDTNSNTGGSSLIQFNVSQELQARHGATAGRLVGGEIANSGASPTNNPIGSQQFGGTTGTIVFYAEVTEAFSDAFPSGDPTVDQGDVLNNRVDDPTTPLRDGIFGDQLRAEQINSPTPTVIGRGSDDSGTSLAIPYGEQRKQIYAINGQRVPEQTASTPLFNVQAGDVITYLLTYSLPISSFENLQLIDLPPLPVIDVDNQGTFSFVRNPASYTFSAGQVGVYVTGQTPGSTGSTFISDTYFSTFAPGNGTARNPTISLDSLRNSVTLNFGTFDDVGVGNRRNTTISVLVSFTVSDDPFAQDLPLTNQLRVLEGSTNAGDTTVEAIQQFELVRPFVTIQKGAVGGRTTGLTAGNIVFAPPSNPTGTLTLGGSPLSGTNSLDTTSEANAIGGLNITNSNPRVDAGDVIRYAIVAQNTGQGDAFDVTITDTIQPDFDRSSFTNLRLFRGDGTQLLLNTDYSFTYNSTTGALSITLVDNYTAGNISTTAGVPVAAEDARAGALSRGQGNGGPITNGSNTIIALYDVTLAASVSAGATITNTATVTNYANNDNGPDLTDPAVIPGATEPTNNATVTTPINLVKQVVSTSEAHTTGNALTIGEIVRYRLVMELAEGTSTTLQLRDQLPSGLTFLDDGTAKLAFVSNGAGITSSTLAGAGLAVSGTFANAAAVTTIPTFVIPGGSISPATFSTGTDVNFDLGNVINNDRDADLEFIVIELNALADNSVAGSNDAGDNRNNNFQTRVSGSLRATSPNVAVSIVEPQISIVKNASPTSADAGDAMTFTITITNSNAANSATAFEVNFTDSVPVEITNVNSAVGTLPSGVILLSDTSVGNNLSYLFNQLAPGQSITITVTGNVISSIVPGQVITNTGNVVYTSLPGDLGTTTNPTGSSTPGAPGTATGERTGSGTAPNDYAANDPATVSIVSIAPEKTLIASSESSTTANDVVIGEIVRYRMVVRIPESDKLLDFRITDALPDGLQFVDDNTAKLAFVTNGPGIVSSSLSGSGLIQAGNESTVASISPTFVIPASALVGGPFGNGTDVVFALGDLDNQDRDSDLEFVVIEFNALVLNVANNKANVQLDNTFQVSINGTNSGTPSTKASVIVREPNVSINKEIIATTGNVVTYRITATNSSAAGTATAFNARVLDILNGTDLSLVPGSVTTATLTGGANGFSNASAGNTVDVSIATLPAGATAVFTYQANVLSTPSGVATIFNTADLTATSLPGDFGTTSNPTGSSVTGPAGSQTGERTGSGGINNYDASDSERIGSIGDRVWFDANGNQVQDANEPGLIGVPVTIRWAGLNGKFDDGDDSLVTVLTGTDGLYTVTGLPVDSPGQFRVSVNTGAPLFTTLGLNAQTFDATAPVTDNQSQVALTPEVPNPRSQDFGYRGTGKLGDRVWLDVNGNGVQDVGEPGLGDVGVTLQWFGQDGVSGGGDDVFYTTKTDASGLYQFTDLPAGTFNVLVDTGTLPTGLSQTYDLDNLTGPFSTANAALTTLTVGQNRTDVDFGYVGAGVIGDVVWYDVNGNGVQESGPVVVEPGIANAKVVLRFAGKDGDLSTSADNFLLTATTDASGKYLFTGLPGGDFLDGSSSNYEVVVTAPSGYVTQTYDATSPTTDSTSSLRLGAGETNLQQDFGYRGASGVELGDFVWEDLNGNGKQDTGELGVSGVEVFLLDKLGSKLAVTTTDGAGKYQFSNLVDSGIFGSYGVQFVAPSGFVFTSANASYAGVNDTNDSDADVITGKTGLYSLTGGTVSDQTADAGVYRLISLGDRVWYDVNNDGKQDASEPGIGGALVTVVWRGADGVASGDDQTFQVSTGADGKWTIENLPPGNFSVSVSNVPSGLAVPTFDLDSGTTNPDSTTAVVGVSGVSRTDVDFGYRGTGNLGDRVWLDVNGNGVQDVGEPGLGDVGVTLQWFGQDGVSGGGDDVFYTTKTDASGLYQFTSLPAGTFNVLVDTGTLPTGLQQTYDRDDLTGPFGTANSAIVTLTPDQIRQDVDFGYVGAGVIGDVVWYDVNGNGVQESGPVVFEPGIANAKVVLRFAGKDGDLSTPSDNFLLTATTDASGKYLFTGLPGGDFLNGTSSNYEVVVTAPSGYVTQTYDATSPTTDSKSSLRLAAGETNLLQDFGYRGPVTQGIGDFVWLDRNGNGKQDGDELGIDGLSVQLVIAGADAVFGTTDDLVIASTITSNGGKYSFPNLVVGEYRVRFDNVAGGTAYVRTVSNSPVANGTTDSDANAISGETGTISVLSNLFNNNIDAGLYLLASVGDRVWYDANNTGVQDPSEDGINNVSVLLDYAGLDGLFGTADDKLGFKSQVTSKDGNYLFTDLIPGNYRVTINTATLPTGLTTATADFDGLATLHQAEVTLKSGEFQATVDFGYRGLSKLGDTVWLDLNKSGVQDSGEPGLPAVQVVLTWAGSDGLFNTSDDVQLGTQTTDSSGFYQFVNLPAGTYKTEIILASLPTGLQQTYDRDDLTGPFATANSAIVTLTPDQIRQDVDFGYVGAGVIGDVVWYDVNGNGVQESGPVVFEPGIANAKVVLRFAGKDGDLSTPSDNFLLTATTDASGKYLFTGLPGGDFLNGTSSNYEVVVTVPSGYVTQTYDATSPTTDSKSSLRLAAGETNLLQDFGYRGASGVELGDFVWEDLNGNGKQDTGEPGVLGVEVFLLDKGGAKLAVTTTDGAGKYQFSNLVDSSIFGSYGVQFVAPSGFVLTSANASYAGVDDTNDSDADAITGKTGLYALTGANSSDQTVDAGVYRLISLGDRVWYDVNNDGVQDGGEPGISGALVTVVWRGADGVASGDDQTFQVSTGADGKWTIGKLPPGNFSVSVSALPDGVVPTYDLDSLLVNPDGTTAVTTISGVNRVDVDFGFAGKGQIGDTIFLDVNGNDIFDGPAEGLAGVRVILNGDLNGDGTPETLTTFTDGNGFYQFVNLRTPTAGLEYTVTVDQSTLPQGVAAASILNTVDPDGGNNNSSKTTLTTAKPSDQAQDFGYRGPGSIGDTVFLDANNNLLPDAGEGITGVQVILSADLDGDGTPETFTTTTDASGQYLFGNLPISTNTGTVIEYTVAVGAGLPEGVVNTVDPDGGNDGSSKITLSQATPSNVLQDFGYRGPGNVGDRVFLDLNNDGAYTPGEGITGVTVTLEADINGDGLPERFTATTDADGFYSFTGLPVSKGGQPLQYAVSITSGLPVGVVNATDPDGGNDNTSLVTLSVANPNNDLQDFGYQGTAKLGDRVWLDINRDGIQGAAGLEPGLTKVGLGLVFAGQDGQFGTADDISTTVTTGNDGTYLFQFLPPGEYQVIVNALTLPENLSATFDQTAPADGFATASLLLGQEFLDLDFGYVGTASVGDRLWLDQNGDGLQQSIEAGVPGATVVLRWAGADEILDTADDLFFTTTTNAQGEYLFQGLPVYAASDDYRATVTALPIAGLKATYDLDSQLINPDETTKFLISASGVNQNRRDVDFGYDGTSTLSGTVYFDQNNSGTPDAGEPGIAGVIITLTGRDVFGNVILDPISGKPYSATTNAQGQYLFDTIIPGTYQLNETQPATYNDGTDRAGSLGGNSGNDVIAGIPVGANQAGVNYDFGELGTFVSGTVFRDDNGDGIQQGAEPGLPGVVIQLVDQATNTTLTTTTDANGNYRFENIPTGNYQILETQPVGYSNSPGTPATLRTITVPLTGLTGQVFGEQLGSLTGTVYIDDNNNATLDSGEPRLPNVAVVLTGTDVSGASVSRTVFTDAAGQYKFEQLLAADNQGYTITEGATPPFSDGLPNTAGSSGGKAVGPNQFTAVTLLAGQNATNYNFGERLPAAPFLSGNVYLDVDKSGTRDTTETGIPDVTITLRGAGADGFFGTADDQFFTQTTDANGNYLFENLTAGQKYRVEESQPLIYGSTTPNLLEIASLPATGLTGQNFGEVLGSIAGKVYFDANSNGSLSPTEPGIPGTTVVLTGTDVNGVSVSRTLSTDGQGNYRFGDLPAGTYVVTETQPAGYVQGTNSVGSLGGNVDAVGDKLTGIVLGGGIDATDYNFGEIGTSVSGQVFHDANRDGQRTPNERPIPGTVIQLVTSDGTVFATTTTGPNGKYEFFNVPPGSYNVVEQQPTGYGDPLVGPFAPNSRPITVSGVPVVNEDFGDTLSSIAGSVYLDAGDDGIRSQGELGLSGVPMLLDYAGPDGQFGTADDVTAFRSASTDFNGDYLFSDLPNGLYRVREAVQPTGFVDGRETAGTIGGDVTINEQIGNIPLPAGTAVTAYNFGELLPDGPQDTTFLAGTVYLDRDQNGQLNPTERTLTGVTIFLDTNNDGVLLPGEPSTTTDASGNYLFTGLTPGQDYNIRQLQPAGYASGPEASTNLISVTNLSLTGITSANFGETAGSISGTVYFDRNPDGVLDLTDQVLPGVTVVLTGNGLTVTAVTDAAGRYEFIDLPAGEYVLTETQPAGYNQGTNTPGTGAVLGTTIDTMTVTLPAGGDSGGNNFGELGTPLSGIIFRDDNQNGTPEPTEPRLPGTILTLLDANGQPVATVTTGTNGTYQFSNLPPGSYTIRQSQPPGYGNSPATPATERLVIVTGTPVTDLNFGETLGRLSGFVYEDYDIDGVRTLTGTRPDQGIPGIVVSLIGVDQFSNNVQLSTTTDANGAYFFENLFPGDYRIVQTQPPLPLALNDGGYYDARDNLGSLGGSNGIKNQFRVTLGNNANGLAQVGVNYNFGEVPPADPFGFVWEDLNNNGLRETGEPAIPGVEVILGGLVNDPFLGLRPITAADVPGGLTRLTDANGRYEFVPIPSGTYTLTQTQPAGFLDGLEQNADTNPPATVTVGNDVFGNILTAPFQIRGPFNFGELRPASIAGTVYLDENRNGVRDPAEPGIPGVAITLNGTDDRNQPVSLQLTTDAAGNYLFGNLRPGSYTLIEAQPANLLQGTNAAGTAGGGEVGTDQIGLINLQVGQNATGYLFGEQPPLPPPPPGVPNRPAPVPPLPPLPPIISIAPGSQDVSKREFLGSTSNGPSTPRVPTERLTPNFAALGSVGNPQPTQFLATAESEGGELVRVFDLTGGQERFRFRPFPGNPGGVRVATADMNGDGIPDIVAAAGPGGGPRVIIYDGNTGAVLQDFLAFEASFSGGLFVAAADFDGDGRGDLILTPDVGGGPRVRVLSAGDPNRVLADFFGIEDPNFRGGARASGGDVNNDGVPDLVVSAGAGGGPRVALFDGRTLANTPTRLTPDFFAFENTLRNGVYITVADVDGDRFADLIFGAGPGGAPRVTAFSGGSLISGAGLVPVANFFAGDTNLRGGVNVVAKDLNGDGRTEVITGSVQTQLPLVRFYDPRTGQVIDEFYAQLLEFTGGIFVG